MEGKFGSKECREQPSLEACVDLEALDYQETVSTQRWGFSYKVAAALKNHQGEFHLEWTLHSIN